MPNSSTLNLLARKQEFLRKDFEDKGVVSAADLYMLVPRPGIAV
jgi:hypothetical protein